MNLKITLDRVQCFETEGESGADEFYVVGTAVAGGKSQTVLTTPLEVNDGQERAFPSDQRIVFDGPASDTQTLHLGLAAFNQDVKGDWTKRQAAVSKMTTAVKALPIPSGSLLVSTACKAADTAFGRVDPDDELGQLVLDVPVKDLKPGAGKKWSCSGDSGGKSSWRYEVYYTIEKV